MKFELYEVWIEDSDGIADLVDTTSSLVEARLIGKAALDDNPDYYVTIYRETDDGELEVVEDIE